MNPLAGEASDGVFWQTDLHTNKPRKRWSLRPNRIPTWGGKIKGDKDDEEQRKKWVTDISSLDLTELYPNYVK